ncbi:hypothetical protein [Notoacmeibacter ruber]|nr:hypothetical protein [Notoacmeibacter ruber]
MRIRAMTASAAAVLLATTGVAMAEKGGKTPYEAISKNADKNGAFENKSGYVTNGKVNFSEAGAKRSVNGKAGDRANENSAIATDDDRDGTRVEPRGLYKKND